MKRFAAILTLLWCGLWAGASLWGSCPANNPVSFNAIPMQGPDPTGNQGYPLAVVGATGCPLDVNIVGGGGGGGCVTQCTSPWVVSGTVAATQSGAWTVGVNNFPATQPVSGTVTANQGTPNAGGASAWPITSDTIGGTSDTDFFSNTVPTPPANSTISSDLRSIYHQHNAWIGIGQTIDGNRYCGLTDAIGYAADASGGGLGRNLGGVRESANQIESGFPLLPFLGNFLLQATAGPVVGYTSADGSSVSVLRTPNVFKTVATAAAGNTAAWTPAAGKSFRLMRWRYTVTDNSTLAAPGVLTVSLNDAGGAIGQADDVFVPAIALVNNGQLAVSPWIDLGNGVLSGAANNVLNVNLSAALTAGTVRVQVCGTEE